MQQQRHRHRRHRPHTSRHHRSMHVVFVHLDLGIGGAEQLVLQLATASQTLGHRVDIVTTRCDPHHCFRAVQPGVMGNLHDCLHVWGRWLPHTVLGRARTACSTVRLLYLARRVARKKAPDLIVLDVLSTPLPLLRLTDASLLFYCHYPDQLLKQQQQHDGSDSGSSSLLGLRRTYRNIMNALERWTVGCADLCVVNSNFTRHVVQATFPNLIDLPVLYPALDETFLSNNSDGNTDGDNAPWSQPRERRIVSLNRYERKKQHELIVQAAHWLRTTYPTMALPEIVIAGGYDVTNVENVEYRGELATLASKLDVPVTFMQSISDAQRADLLQHSICLVYTPENEHFGIVPLEAMAAGTPVIACNSGGPTETIVHEVTGFLCDPTPENFGRALYRLLQDEALVARMGMAGREHVTQYFGMKRLEREWQLMTLRCYQQGRLRLQRTGQYRVARVLFYLMDALSTLLLAALLTWVLRRLDILEPSESIWGKARDYVKGMR